MTAEKVKSYLLIGLAGLSVCAIASAILMNMVAAVAPD